jgi:hypothetical protein
VLFLFLFRAPVSLYLWIANLRSRAAWQMLSRFKLLGGCLGTLLVPTRQARSFAQISLAGSVSCGPVDMCLASDGVHRVVRNEELHRLPLHDDDNSGGRTGLPSSSLLLALLSSPPFFPDRLSWTVK